MSAGRFSETISPKCGNAGHFRPAMQKSCRTILDYKIKIFSRSKNFYYGCKTTPISFYHN
ncbi:Uncharacterized protein dnm_089250 [Desulfonema magnum]|uniref:Uncharacterized protein n=1 Tax=Desulfonema magnum TaxID=45655 RepID=A0A975GTC3_9BACT|nr:Uncharacterized protein dnm_089250 [Desulfonema magnum]